LTSTTSVAIGTGSKTFTTLLAVPSSALVVGQRVRVASSLTNYMEGVVTSFISKTLIVNVDTAVGSGSLATWNIAPIGTSMNGTTTLTPAPNTFTTTSYVSTGVTTSVAAGTSNKAFVTVSADAGTGTSAQCILSFGFATGTPTAPANDDRSLHSSSSNADDSLSQTWVVNTGLTAGTTYNFTVFAKLNTTTGSPTCTVKDVTIVVMSP
jgi:hypothetical protein